MPIPKKYKAFISNYPALESIGETPLIKLNLPIDDINSCMNDLNTMERIMHTNNPYQCKKLGRQVKNWNQELWDQHKCDIMFDALRYKFSQNDDILQKLLSTGNSTLAEASPRDRIWGIGLNITDAQSGKDWRGKNLLGKTLMRVREDLS